LGNRLPKHATACRSMQPPAEACNRVQKHAKARVAAKHTTRDSTKYGRSARSFSEHHGQRISHAIVMTDALNICEGTTKLKKRLVMQSRAD